MASAAFAARPICPDCDISWNDGDILTRLARARHICPEPTCAWIAEDCDALVDHFRFFRHRLVCEGCYGAFTHASEFDIHLYTNGACKYCNVHFDSMEALAEHLQLPRDQCAGCGFQACASGVIEQHWKKTGHRTVCQDCNDDFRSAEDLQYHLNGFPNACKTCHIHEPHQGLIEHRAAEHLECPKCQMIAPSYEALQSHWEDTKHRLICQDCIQWFDTAEDHVWHLWGQAACNQCHQHHFDQEDLTEHTLVATHSVSCKSCLEELPNGAALKGHLREVLACKVCNEHCFRADLMEKHCAEEDHAQYCKGCFVSVADGRALQAHLKKAKACLVCHDHFDNKQALKLHLSISGHKSTSIRKSKSGEDYTPEEARPTTSSTQEDSFNRATPDRDDPDWELPGAHRGHRLNPAVSVQMRKKRSTSQFKAKRSASEGFKKLFEAPDGGSRHDSSPPPPVPKLRKDFVPSLPPTAPPPPPKRDSSSPLPMPKPRKDMSPALPPAPPPHLTPPIGYPSPKTTPAEKLQAINDTAASGHSQKTVIKQEQRSPLCNWQISSEASSLSSPRQSRILETVEDDDDEEEEESRRNRVTYICSYCGAEATNTDDMQKHLLIHLPFSFTCPLSSNHSYFSSFRRMLEHVEQTCHPNGRRRLYRRVARLPFADDLMFEWARETYLSHHSDPELDPHEEPTPHNTIRSREWKGTIKGSLRGSLRSPSKSLKARSISNSLNGNNSIKKERERTSIGGAPSRPFFCRCCGPSRKYASLGGLIQHLESEACTDGLYSEHIFGLAKALSKDELLRGSITDYYVREG